MILVIEDDEMMRDLLQMILENEGYAVLCAGDGVEAVQLHERHEEKIRLILFDMELPRLNGLEAYRRIKKIDPSVKAIFVSGFFDERLKRDLEHEGVRHLISKPFVASEVVTLVREALGE